jgi:hypothetical protein
MPDQVRHDKCKNERFFKALDFTISTLTYSRIIISVSNNLEIIVSTKRQWSKQVKQTGLILKMEIFNPKAGMTLLEN